MADVMEGATAGDPTSAVKWTRKSTRTVSRILRISHTKAWKMLRRAKYRLRFNRKRLTRRSSPDRNKQFTNINKLKDSFTQRGQPVVSVDAKKRELVGLFKNQGREWRKAPVDVDMYDFPSDADGVAIPYGIYDIRANRGAVYVGTSHDTPQFAAENVARWWRHSGQKEYPGASHLLIFADSGGSNGARVRMWKWALQKEVADRFGLEVTVSHFPTGASKWNPIEHRLFSEISKHWAGQPLKTYSTVVNLIATTTTQTGLQVRSQLITKHYPTAQKVSDQNMQAINLDRHAILPAWNYTIAPRQNRN